MRGGALDRRITFQSKSVSQDETGQEIATWTDFATVFAGRRDSTARDGERFAGKENVADIDTVFTVRYSPAYLVKPDTHRILFEGRLYNILGLVERGRREGFDIAACARAEASNSEN